MRYFLFFILGMGALHLGMTNQHITGESSYLTDSCHVKNATVRGGEKITYEIFYNLNFIWVSAGEVIFRMDELDDMYHLKAAGRTYASYEWFFKVRDTFDSYVDKESMLPQKAVRVVNEGKYTKYDACTFDRENAKAISTMGKNRQSADADSVQITSCTHDILSLVYMMRNIDFAKMKKGNEFVAEVYLDRELYPITISYKGIQKKKRIKGIGRCNTLHFEPELIVGEVFKEDSGMKVWVSNDRNRIPLLIESPVSVGSIKVVLKDFVGLKYPLEI